MTDLQIGFAGLAAILVLVALRMPIGVALALVAIVGLNEIAGPTVTMSLTGSLPYEFAANWELSAVPMFLLMGAIVYRSGLSDPLFAALRVWLRFLPGGLAVASNFACAIFAAACGSSVATTVAMGRIAIPEMLKAGYSPGLAVAVCRLRRYARLDDPALGHDDPLLRLHRSVRRGFVHRRYSARAADRSGLCGHDREPCHDQPDHRAAAR